MGTPLITRREAEVLGDISPSIINKAVEQKVIPVSRGRNRSLIDARDLAALAVIKDLPFALPVKSKKALARWMRAATTGEEWALSLGIAIRRTDEISRVVDEAIRYTDARDRFVDVNPAILGGEPVVKDTRLPLRTIAGRLAAGDTAEMLAREYPEVDPAVFGFAPVWADANPRRGRPSPLALDRLREAPEPKARANVLARRLARR